jgi:hypothetical protein
MKILSDFGPQGHAIVDPNPPAALFYPSSGALLHRITGAAKTVAQIFVAPGGGLNRKRRRQAEAHDVVNVTFRGVWPAPSCHEFDASTIAWAVSKAEQISVWSAPDPAEHEVDLAMWMVEAAHAGSNFQTIIETVPCCVAEWCEVVARWKGPTTEVRFFEQGDER